MQTTIHEAIRDFDRFDAVIDVRSPDEWATDRLPGAINLPVLSNQERAEIGNLYAESSFAAKKLLRGWRGISPRHSRRPCWISHGSGDHSSTAGAGAIGVRRWRLSWSALAGSQPF